jgi:hypothetical protein
MKKKGISELVMRNHSLSRIIFASDGMDKRTEGALQIILAIVIIILVVYFSGNIAQLKDYGYLGAFVISALSSATLFFPAPGWAIIAAMGRYLDPIPLGIVAGLGSAIGELTDRKSTRLNSSHIR